MNLSDLKSRPHWSYSSLNQLLNNRWRRQYVRNVSGYANRVYKTLEEIEEDFSEALRPFWENSKRVLQLLGVENYLLSSANAS